MSDPDNPEMDRSIGENSEVTGASPVQQADDVSGSERKSVEDETDAAKLEDTSNSRSI